MSIALSRDYASRFGAPVIAAVDPRIFTERYFSACLDCGFCRDACCAHGVDIDLPAMTRILDEADRLEPAIGIARAEWFEMFLTDDPDFPGGIRARTAVRDGACIFLDRARRGCRLHRQALESGIEVAVLKPIVSALFPVTFDNGVLQPSDEIVNRMLVCRGPGESLYRGARASILGYFGSGLVAELDALEASIVEPPAEAA